MPFAHSRQSSTHGRPANRRPTSRSPSASWTSCANDATSTTGIDGWLAVFPGLAIASVVLALNLVGDGLNDAFNPRLKER